MNSNKTVKCSVTDVTNVTVVSEVLLCSYRTDHSAYSDWRVGKINLKNMFIVCS